MAESPNVPHQYPDDDPLGHDSGSHLAPHLSPFDALQGDGPLSPNIHAAQDDDDGTYTSDPQPDTPAEPPAQPPPPTSSAPPLSLPPKPSQPPANPLPQRPAAQPHPQSRHLPDGLVYNPALHPPKRDLPVPDRIPGEPVLDGDKHWNLKKHLSDLCGTHGTARCVPLAPPSVLVLAARDLRNPATCTDPLCTTPLAGSRAVSPSASTTRASSSSSKKSASFTRSRSCSPMRSTSRMLGREVLTLTLPRRSQLLGVREVGRRPGPRPHRRHRLRAGGLPRASRSPSRPPPALFD